MFGHDENKKNTKKQTKADNKKEAQFVNDVTYSQQIAVGGNRAETQDYWDDEYLITKGDQWDTSLSPISNEDKTNRPNSVSNFILPTLMNIVDGLTSSTPQTDISGREHSDDAKACVLQDTISYISYINKYQDEWKETVLQFIQYGILIGKVVWDPRFIGGSGPTSYMGEVLVQFQDKDEIYFDPAIRDLKRRFQEQEFINLVYRKKMGFIEDTWELGKNAIEDYDDVSKNKTEGQRPNQATIIEHWHKGKPEFVSEENKQLFLDKAEEFKDEPVKVKMYKDMANGSINGVHCAYVVGNILLEYIPYVNEDGLYPFVYRVLYKDERNPYGYGEVRNIMNPQIMYNKLMDIQLEAMSLQGLGGYLYEKGAFSDAQMRDYKAKMHTGGEALEVNSLAKIKQRDPVIVPQSLQTAMVQLKENLDTTSQNTAIAQGVSPGANVPYASVRDLGARADVRNKGKLGILEGFMIDMTKLTINRIAENYTQEREYRIRGDKSGVIMKLVYTGIKDIIKMQDKKAQLAALIQLKETVESMDKSKEVKYGKMVSKDIMNSYTNSDGDIEYYVPDYDMKVKIVDERPQTWQHFEQIAMAMYPHGLGPKSFWDTIVDGKLPDKEIILKELEDMQSRQAQQDEPKQMNSADVKQINQAQ